MRQKLLTHFAAVLLYGLIVVIVTYPLITNLSSVLIGFVYGDAHEMAHHLWWFRYALQNGLPLYDQPLSAYPDGIEGVTLWANPLQFFPAWLLLFVLPLPAAANLTILMMMALNGWSMFFLTGYLTAENAAQRREKENVAPLRSAVTLLPAFIAGLVFMLYPTMQGHLAAGHAGLMVQWGVPLFVWALLRLREGGGWRRILLAALFLLVSVWGHTLQLIYVVLPLVGVMLLWLAWRREWKAAARVVAAVTAGGVALITFLLPVLSATLGTSAYTDEGGAVRYSADLLGIVSPSFFHPLLGGLNYPRRVLGVNLDEGSAYIGMGAGLLAALALWKVSRARVWGWLALVAWVLSLGPLLKVFDQPVRFTVDGYESYIALPWALLQDLPLFSLARTPGRFNFTLALAVAVLAGYGAARLLAVRILLVVLMLFIAFEYQTFFPLPTIPAAIPAAVAALGDDVRAVFDVPWDNLVAAKYGLYLQTAHQRPLIAGHVTRRTPVSPAKLTLLEGLDPSLLHAAGADVVIVHRAQDVDGTLMARARAQLGAPFYEDNALALFRTPAPQQAPAFTVSSPFPPDESSAVESSLDTYLYSDGEGWATFTAALQADRRVVSLRLDGVPLHEWTLDGETEVVVPVPVDAASYHTLTLQVEPPCPRSDNPALACRTVQVSGLSVEAASGGRIEAVPFERGVTLTDVRLPETIEPGETLPVWLSWRFSQPLTENDIRFVHLVDASGVPVAQQDNTLGARAAGSTWAEAVNLAIPADLPPGTYRVMTGWYTFPEIQNFRLLTGETAAELGMFEISNAD